MNNINFQYISIDTVANRILRHPLLKDLNYEDIIFYTVDVLKLINIPRSYIEKSKCLPVIDYKAKLPNDNLNVKSVDYISRGGNIPMVIATDSLHNHLDKIGDRNSSMYTYSINNGMIKLNQKNGEVFVVYDSIKCDENGIPMIPDNINVEKAIENYIKVQVFTMLADLNKISFNSVDRAEQDYSWYIGKAQTAFQGFINDDDLESYLRDIKKLFLINKSHDTRHMYNVQREIRYKNG